MSSTNSNPVTTSTPDFNLNGQATYQGTCVEILDSGYLFDDATEIAQCVEKAKDVDKETFIKGLAKGSEVPEGCNFFMVGKTGRIVVYIAYNSKRDTHYFWS